VEILSGRRKQDDAAESAADALIAQAEQMGIARDGTDVISPSELEEEIEEAA
jgi:hypothetical protein